MPISVLAVLLATIPGGPQATRDPGERYCITGFCPVPDQNRMPGGVMYLAIGLIWVGVAGLRSEGRKKGEPARDGNRG